MKKWIIFVAISFYTVFFCYAQILEQWTYSDGSNGPLSSELSLTGTGNSFGSGASFLQVKYSTPTSGYAVATMPASDYFGGISAPTYQGLSNGFLAISYDIRTAFFLLNPTGQIQIGFGLRSNTSDDCKVFFQYQSENFYLTVVDANGTQTSAPIASGGVINNLSIKQVYNLDLKGTPGSFRVYYSIGTENDVEIFTNTLTLNANFTTDKFTFEIPTTGNSWTPMDELSFDNILLEKPVPSLEFIQESTSILTNNGSVADFPNITFEPGDILQIVTTNMNTSLITVSDVSTTLYADPAAFSITPTSSNAYPSLEPNETYTGVFQVEILDGATNGPSTFTVTNRINSSSASPTVFSTEFGAE